MPQVRQPARDPAKRTAKAATTRPKPPAEDDLLDALAGHEATAQAAVAAASAQSNACPNCTTPLAPGAVVCVDCGYNRQTGQLMGKTSAAAPTVSAGAAAKSLGGAAAGALASGAGRLGLGTGLSAAGEDPKTYVHPKLNKPVSEMTDDEFESLQNDAVGVSAWDAKNSEVSEKVKNMDPDDVARTVEDRPELAAQVEFTRGLRDVLVTSVFKQMFGPIDILWFPLAAGTAWKVAGASSD